MEFIAMIPVQRVSRARQFGRTRFYGDCRVKRRQLGAGKENGRIVQGVVRVNNNEVFKNHEIQENTPWRDTCSHVTITRLDIEYCHALLRSQY